MALSIVEKVELVIRSPTRFFNAVKNEKGVKDAFVYLAVISAVSSVLNFYLNPFSASVFALFGQLGIALIVVMWLFTIFFSFVIYGFFHLFVLLLGGKQGYHNTYKAFAYGSTPAALLGWVPFLFLNSFNIAGLIAMVLLMLAIYIWSLYITIKGISILQKMSMLRSLGVILLPVVIILLIIILIAGLLIFTVLSLAMSGGGAGGISGYGGLPSQYGGLSEPQIQELNRQFEEQLMRQPPGEIFAVSVDTAPPDIVYVRIANTGTTGFGTSEVFVSVDDQVASCSWDTVGKISPGEAATCKIRYSCTSGTNIRVSTPAAQHTTTCLGT